MSAISTVGLMDQGMAFGIKKLALLASLLVVGMLLLAACGAAEPRL